VTDRLGGGARSPERVRDDQNNDVSHAAGRCGSSGRSLPTAEMRGNLPADVSPTATPTRCRRR
jgi:hypothetical protein